MFGAFIDDSGSHAQSPLMVLAAVVAKKEVWDTFSDDWQAVLGAEKPIDYFKSSEAAVLNGCFAGFTREEADAKVESLTDLTLNRIYYGLMSAISWSDFTEIVQGSGLRPKGTLKYFVRHPFFLCFHDIISCVGQAQINMSLQGKVDFMFDNQDKWGDRCIRLFNELKPDMPEPLREVLGEAHQGDDKVYLPLQAADLIAWQCRHKSKNFDGSIPSTRSYTMIVEAQKVAYNAISRHALREFVGNAFRLLPSS